MERVTFTFDCRNFDTLSQCAPESNLKIFVISGFNWWKMNGSLLFEKHWRKKWCLLPFFVSNETPSADLKLYLTNHFDSSIGWATWFQTQRQRCAQSKNFNRFLFSFFFAQTFKMPNSKSQMRKKFLNSASDRREEKKLE